MLLKSNYLLGLIINSLFIEDYQIRKLSVCLRHVRMRSERKLGNRIVKMEALAVSGHAILNLQHFW